ncbi:hypothetical protein SLEP1_g38158 [Rubroshorea leprosula]|uniref:Uncharacterized protein n=1 Tax=Rubroshorea leprosula TaxID=152421 RepID=A0AAV5KXN0_9ROSI|nr:hypothetical protein SLEP1_g38158 [Rubroshorea leprosula]
MHTSLPTMNSNLIDLNNSMVLTSESGEDIIYGVPTIN